MLNLINQKTKFAFVIGNPISHSWSPPLHNACFHEFSMNDIYLPLCLNSVDLPKVLFKLKKIPCSGFNVTFPLKEKILPLLDQLDQGASQIGSVNTVVMRQGRFIGYNTDAQAFGISLSKLGLFKSKGSRVLVFGAGRAARAILFQLGVIGVKSIGLSNRTLERAYELKKWFHNIFPNIKLECIPFQRENISKAVKNIDLIVNTTSIGFAEKKVSFPIEFQKVSRRVILVDLGYPQERTLFWNLTRVRFPKDHWFILDGLEMLVNQAALSFSLWTGREPPFSFMRETIKKNWKGF